MEEENKIINDYLNPLLGDLMQQSLNSILEMKDQNLIEKDDKETISFILTFLEEALQYYSSIKDTRNLAILSDLNNYLLKLTT